MLLVPALVIGWAAAGLAQEQIPDAPQNISAGEPNSGEQLSISFDNGRLTAVVRNSSLRRALEEVGAQAHFTVIFGEMADEKLESLELENVPLDEGLRYFLSDHDSFFYYNATSDAPASLRTLWVYSKGAASALRPVPPEAWASSTELIASLSQADPESRALAYEALISRPDGASREAVIEALKGAREKDEGVRQRIFTTAMTRGMAVPPEVLGDLVRLDQSEQIRWLALDALSEDPSAEDIAHVALADSSEVVRNRAKEILADRNAAKHRRGDAEQTRQDNP
jgi:hypothetical protein